MGLYQDVRPTTLDGLIGQASVVTSLKKMLEEQTVPHALGFCGPTGTGKTTAARAISKVLGCAEYEEKNCADLRGIDDIRKIRDQMQFYPLGGKYRMWVLDEAHQFTKPAQEAALKIVEDCQEHVYLVVCTTEPDGLIKTLRDRLLWLNFQPIAPGPMRKLLESTISDVKLPEMDGDVLDAIVDHADGSARHALQLLEQAAALEDHEERIKAVAGGMRAAQINFCRELLGARDQRKLLSYVSTTDSEPEKVRRMVLGYMTSVACNAKDVKDLAKAANVINCFKDNYFASGKAGLILSIADVLLAKK